MRLAPGLGHTILIKDATRDKNLVNIRHNSGVQTTGRGTKVNLVICPNLFSILFSEVDAVVWPV